MTSEQHPHAIHVKLGLMKRKHELEKREYNFHPFRNTFLAALFGPVAFKLASLTQPNWSLSPGALWMTSLNCGMVGFLFFGSVNVLGRIRNHDDVYNSLFAGITTGWTLASLKLFFNVGGVKIGKLKMVATWFVVSLLGDSFFRYTSVGERLNLIDQFLPNSSTIIEDIGRSDQSTGRKI